MRGICFKQELFENVPRGTKTKTRRIELALNAINRSKLPRLKHGYPNPAKDKETMLYATAGAHLGDLSVIFPKTFTFQLYKYSDKQKKYTSADIIYIATPRYKINEVLFLKEPYRAGNPALNHPTVFYKYLGTESGRFENKLFMPERHARIFIQITDIKIKRVRDLDLLDYKAEGLEAYEQIYFKPFRELSLKQKKQYGCFEHYVWEKVWKSINDADSFDQNYYTFEYSFKIHHTKPELIP